MAAAYADELGANDLLAKIIAGKDVTLLKTLSARDEKANLLDLHLNKIYREVNTIFEESGAYDLFLGYPWVEGKFLEGNVARCPVMLFPVRLIRDYRSKPRWKLESIEDEDILFNKTFFLAYEKFQRTRLSPSFWEEQPERFPDVQGFLNFLYSFLQKEDVQVNFNQELFEFKLRTFPEFSPEMFDNLPIGKLKFQPYAILGIFPQSDSSLIQDYETIELDPEKFGLSRFLNPDWATEQANAPSPPKETRRHFVTPIDESQEQVLLKVRAGKNVVVHGPPGTGKSQVILNLVADAMAEGKKVLVCSQKRAALDVVYQRLAELGLGRFAALIHDYRSDRSKLFDKIRRQIDEIPQFQQERISGALTKWEYDFMLDARQIDEYNTLFEDLYQSLIKRRSCGLSAHDLYLAAEPGVPQFALGQQAQAFTIEQLRIFLRKLGEILEYVDLLDPNHPWYYRIPFHSITLERRKRYLEIIRNLPLELQTLRDQLAAISPVIGNALAPETLQNQLQPFFDLRSRLENQAQKTDFANATDKKTKTETWVSNLKSAKKLIAQQSKFQILDGFASQLWVDLFEHAGQYQSNKGKAFRFLNLNFLKARWYIHAIIKNKKQEASTKQIEQLCKEAETLKAVMQFAADTNELPFLADFPATETPEKQQIWLDRKQFALDTVAFCKKITHFGVWLPKTGTGIWDQKAWDQGQAQVSAAQQYAVQLQKWEEQLKGWLHPNQIEQLRQLLPGPIPAESYCKSLEQHFQSDFEDLRSLDELFSQLSTSEKAIYGVVQDRLGQLPEMGVKAFLHSLQVDFYRFWLEKAEEETPSLKEVSARRMANKQEDYAEKVAARQKAVAGLVDRKMKDRIVERQEFNRLNNPVTYRGIYHQVTKKRLLWPVRKLVQECWEESLSTLLPCWLASPESVAAVFPMEAGFFDLVIFDEASQCFVERALPTVLRGRSAVVAGDEKQLPPFDLYSVKAEEDDSAFFENELALEVKSILDLARASFSESRLSWHYRSQEEELINFSNHAFYDGRLNVMPPATANPLFRPIEWIAAEGIWENNRNLTEAEEVVALVEKLVQDPEKPSIGIVTFNFHQQEAIRDRFESRLSSLTADNNQKELPALLSALEKGEGEDRQGIFIKNIENVQGDERDIIIFSVAYAKDKQGKLVSHFGLLNQEGGENRLNVAITRARKKVYVVCSFQPEQLRVEEALHPGPKLLKQYLLYAHAVSRNDAQSSQAILSQLAPTAPENSVPEYLSLGTLSEKVAAMLKKRGHSIARNVGETNYRVDIAIRKPNSQNSFLLGIECEDTAYLSGRSPKEREIYRWNLLEKRGWKMHRVWARNFYLDPEKELDKIEALLK